MDLFLQREEFRYKYLSAAQKYLKSLRRRPMTIDIIDKNWWKSMEIDTHNVYDLRFSSIPDINRLIAID